MIWDINGILLELLVNLVFYAQLMDLTICKWGIHWNSKGKLQETRDVKPTMNVLVDHEHPGCPNRCFLVFCVC